MADDTGTIAPDAPRRVLGTFDATCVVCGAIIGVGIFFTPSSVARAAGSVPMAMLAWAGAGVIALLGALTFAAIGNTYHRNGAQYDVLRDGYGPIPAFLFVVCNATAIQAGAIAIIAIICVQNLALAIAPGRDAPDGVTAMVLAAGLIVGLVVANALGVRWGSRIQNLTVVAKLLTLLVICLVAVIATPEPSVSVEAEGEGATGSFVALLFAAMVPAFFSYGGWQHALWITGEVRRPERTVPVAIIGGVLVVTAAYLLVNLAYFELLGFDGVSGSTSLAADAMGVAYPELGRRVIAGAVAVSAFGVLNAQLLSGPRLVQGMARDGRFFGVFARLSLRSGAPVAAILLLGGVSLLLLFAAGPNGVDRLLTGVVFIDGVFFAMTGVALIVVRRARGEGPGLIDFIALLFAAGEMLIVVGALSRPDDRTAALIGVAWIVGAGLVYALCFRGGARTVGPGEDPRDAGPDH